MSALRHAALVAAVAAAALPGACGARADLPRARGLAQGPAGAGGVAGAGPGGAGTGGLGAAGGAGGAGGNALDAVVRACALATSCAGDADGWPRFSPSVCVDAFARLGWDYQSPSSLPDPDLAARLLACATPGTSCADFRSCWGGDWVGLSRCREGGYCVGNAITSWQGGPSFDCGAIGGTCMDLWSGALRACCNAAPCSTTTDIACTGTVATFCGGWGEHVTFDCGPSGRTCNPGTSYWEPCSGTGAPCTATDPVTCAGAVASYCSAGRLAEQDCAGVWSATACAQGDTYGPCRPAGVACSPLDDPGSCQGTDLEVCVDGTYRTVSCTALGFDVCDLPSVGYARCRLGA
ncbi:MAG: hypothetical protein HY908_37900 [Myxococcales bacterium]|nr:hypothetical protein [Myxococcales bacterium]